MDGLRYDRLIQAADKGYFPHLKKYFIDRGTQMESYASRSLTLPSWSTIMTGFELDVHGIRSNTPTSRLEHRIAENYQEPPKDLKEFTSGAKNPAFKRIENDKTGEEGKVWLPGYFTPEQTFISFMPVVNGARSSVVGLISYFFEHLSEFANGSLYFPSMLDIETAETTANAIKNDHEGKLRLIVNWYSAVDEASHFDNDLLPIVYQTIDQGIHSILTAAQHHPSLKNATVFLISDHGHTAGYGPFDEKIFQTNTSSQNREVPLLENTGFNITEFLAGDYHDYERYQFVVGAATAPEPKYKLALLDEFHLQSFKYIHPKGKGHPNALVDSAGDNLVQVYLRGKADVEKKGHRAKSSWKNRLSFYELSHFEGARCLLDIPSDLLDFRLPFTRLSNETLAQNIFKLTNHHPVDLFAMALTGDAVAQSTTRFVGDQDSSGAWLREPVLVMTRGDLPGQHRTGLIFIRSFPNGTDEFKYVVVTHFDQLSDGQILGETSEDPKQDPLEYLDTVGHSSLLAQWHTDREWLQLARHHFKPTAIFALARILTLSSKYMDPHSPLLSEKIKTERQGEIPDFILTANPGYAFHSDSSLESDHGGILRDETRNCFLVSSLNEEKYKKHIESEIQMLSRDFMPTILDYARIREEGNDLQILPQTQGMSFKEEIEKLQKP